jgi:hypothetical protein
MTGESKKQRKNNQRPSLRQLNKELKKPNFFKKIFLFLYFNIRMKGIILLVLTVVLSNVLYDMTFMNPPFFALVLLMSIFISEISLEYIDLPSYFLFGLFTLCFCLLIRELWKAYRAVRY